MRARFLHAIATSYSALGLYDRALPVAEEALGLRREHLDPSDPALPESMDDLGQIRAFVADYVRAEPLLNEALALRREHLPEDDPAVIESLGHVGALLQDRGEFQAATQPLREALERSEHRFGPDSVEAAHCIDNLATNLQSLGRVSDAESLYRHALAIRKRQLGPDDPDLALSLNNLGASLTAAGSYAEARALLERALSIRQKVYGDAHPLVGFTQLELASLLESVRDLDASEVLARKALAIFRNTLDEGHRKTTDTLNLLAIIRMDQRAYDDAVALFGDVARRQQASLGADHLDTLVAEENLAHSLYYAGQLDRAEALQRDLRSKFRSDDGTGSNVMNLQNLASTLSQQKRAAEALPIVRESLDIQRQLTGERSRPYALALREVAVAEQRTGDAASAEAHFRASVELVEQIAPAGGFGTFSWTIPYADFLVGANRCDEALPLLQSARRDLDKLGTANPIWLPQIELLIGACLRRSGRVAEAKLRLQSARSTLRAMPGIAFDLFPTSRQLYDES